MLVNRHLGSEGGATIADFVRITEFAANLVKLDISPGRQALVLANDPFRRLGGLPVGRRGIETDTEAATLVRFGGDLGQRVYWFGRPAAIAQAS